LEILTLDEKNQHLFLNNLLELHYIWFIFIRTNKFLKPNLNNNPTLPEKVPEPVLIWQWFSYFFRIYLGYKMWNLCISHDFCAL